MNENDLCIFVCEVNADDPCTFVFRATCDNFDEVNGNGLCAFDCEVNADNPCTVVYRATCDYPDKVNENNLCKKVDNSPHFYQANLVFYGVIDHDLCEANGCDLYVANVFSYEVIDHNLCRGNVFSYEVIDHNLCRGNVVSYEVSGYDLNRNSLLVVIGHDFHLYADFHVIPMVVSTRDLERVTELMSHYLDFGVQIVPVDRGE